MNNALTELEKILNSNDSNQHKGFLIIELFGGFSKYEKYYKEDDRIKEIFDIATDLEWGNVVDEDYSLQRIKDLTSEIRGGINF